MKCEGISTRGGRSRFCQGEAVINRIHVNYRCTRCQYLIKQAPGMLRDGTARVVFAKLLGELPPDWYSEMIETLVRAAYRRGVMVPGGASKIVKGVESLDTKDQL